MLAAKEGAEFSGVIARSNEMMERRRERIVSYATLVIHVCTDGAHAVDQCMPYDRFRHGEYRRVSRRILMAWLKLALALWKR